MSRQWLMSEETRRRVEVALQAPTHEANGFNCEDWPPGCGCAGCDGDELRKKALEDMRANLQELEC